MPALSSPRRRDQIISSVVQDDTRLEVLQRYQILDTDPEPAFDRAARLAAHLFDAPTALVNFLDENRQWFKSTLGFEENETGFDVSICVYTLDEGGVSVVEDLSADERFADNPYVTDHGLRFYAGAPLTTSNDHRLGTLCVLDPEPRSPSEETLNRLTDLANMVVDELELRRERLEHEQTRATLEESRELLRRAQDLADVGGSAYDPQADAVTWTDQTYRIFGLSPEADLDLETAVDFYTPDSRSVLESEVERLLDEGGTYDLELDVVADDGDRRRVRTIAEAQRDDGTTTQIVGAIQDITERKAVEEDLRRSQEQLSMAVEGGNIGTWNWDLTTDEVLFNERWAGMLGYTREELDFHFRTWEDLVHPEDLPRALDELEAYIMGDADIYNPEIRMWTKAGEWKWIQTIGRVIERDEDGAIARAAGIHLDIDDRKRAEMALREAKSRYQTLVDHFPDGGVFLFDEDLEYTIAGGKGLEDVGLAPSDFEGNTPRDLFPPEIAEAQMRYYRHALRGKKSVFEQTLDGQHYRVQTLPVRDEEGDVVAGMAVSQNITERKKTRQRLEQYQEYTDRLLNAADDLFFVLDDEAQFQRWNAQIPEVTGYADDELGEMTAFDLVPEAERERVTTAITDGLMTGTAQIEVPLVRKDEPEIPYEFVGSLVEHPDGGLRIVGIGRDITERRRRQEALERQNDLFTKAEDIASVGAWEYDVSADTATLTEEACRIFGFAPEAAPTPERCIDAFHPDDQSTIREAFTQAVETGTSYDLKLRLITTDDERRWVRTRGESQTENGEVVRVRGTIQDVTGSVRRRQDLREAKEAAEKADRTKTALLSNMNHEIRTPLTSIITFSKLVRDNPGAADQFADRILNGGRRLLHTLNTVMELAELEGDGLSLDPAPLRLSDIAWSVVSHFQERAGEKVELRTNLSDETRSVRLDEHLTERILTHLVHNAVKFTEAGTVTVSAQTGPDEAIFTVTDPGIGIDPDFLPHVFDEFTQASSGNDRAYEGNGIGLTVVQRMVQAMNGTIDIDSSPGEGTTVTVRLPVD